MARFIPDEVAARAARVLRPWSRATPAERREATLILSEHRRQRLNARFGRWALHDERFVEEDPV